MVEIRDYFFTYEGGEKEIDGVCLIIEKGEFVAISGVSGSGKTTIGRAINGLIPHFFIGDRQGDIIVNNENINDYELWQIGKRVASVFQDPNSQFFAHSVKDEVAFGAENYGMDPKEIEEMIDVVLDKLNIKHLINRNMFTLSNGEKQKVAIASALVANPSIFIFDEPSANLDIKSTFELSEIMKQLKDEGKTIIVAEHRMYYLKDLLDRFVYIEKGKIKKEYTKEEFNSFKKEDIASLGIRTNDLFKIDVQNNNLKKNNERSLQVKNLSFSYKKNIVLDDINFNAQKGEIIALMGLNGVGKTTLTNILAGLTKEKKGEVTINDNVVKPNERKKYIHFVMQETDCQLFSESVFGELELGFSNKENKENDKAILKRFGLWDHKDKHPAALSGGQKQRLTLAISEKSNNDIMIFDEPTSGLDGENMRITADYFKRQGEKGKTIIIITHDYELVMSCCDRVIILNEGRIDKDMNITTVNKELLLQTLCGSKIKI